VSDIKIVIEERQADIGNFSVGRLLPFRKKRMLGPFIFLDHMGPVILKPDRNVDVAPHPHIGLSTLTYLFEGSLMHRDSLGNAIEIKPGEVNWMTAGKGIVHSERTPEYQRNSVKNFHGLQFWIALPKNIEQTEPGFIHIEKEDLPCRIDGALSYKLIAGEALGEKSPVPVYSKLFFIELKSETNQTVSICKDLFGEAGVYILEGEIKSGGNVYEKKQIVVPEEICTFEFEMNSGGLVYIIGGEPFPEERFIYWNFVSSERELIDKAKEMWSAQKFPEIPGESGFVPLPE
jgi:hypothetical protein